MKSPSPSSALPPVILYEAVPKGISGRASYFQVCLAFHSYPQLIAYFCNSRAFGPPVSITSPSPWTWIDRPASGLFPATKTPYSDSVSLRLPYSVRLATENNSLTHYTKGTPSPLAGLRLLVRTRFQVLFHSPLRGSFRLSLTVLVHYRSVSSI